MHRIFLKWNINIFSGFGIWNTVFLLRYFFNGKVWVVHSQRIFYLIYCHICFTIKSMRKMKPEASLASRGKNPECIEVKLRTTEMKETDLSNGTTLTSCHSEFGEAQTVEKICPRDFGNIQTTPVSFTWSQNCCERMAVKHCNGIIIRQNCEKL